jgi:putative protein kinase ArgK-like GTPase of G3E family
VVEQIDQHRQYLLESGEWAQREQARLGAELENLLRETLISRWRSSFSTADYQGVLDRVVLRKLTPQQAVGVLLDGKKEA